MTKSLNITKKAIGAVLCWSAMLLISSCEKGCTDPEAANYNSTAREDPGTCQYHPSFTVKYRTIKGKQYTVIEGRINRDFRITADQDWMISGPVVVESGAELVIHGGAKVYADHEQDTYLLIQSDASINAAGAPDLPVVFTSASKTPQPGDWGGIIINGKARCNLNGSLESSVVGKYGGQDDTDNSGKLGYVRVEYAGKTIGPYVSSGFRFNGVGNQTKMNHLQAYKCLNDGFEFIGGSVNLRYAVSTGNRDDSFDWAFGWRGKGQFWIGQQDTKGGDRGIEGDNSMYSQEAAPISNPTISNITLIGAMDADGFNEGIKLREGTKAELYNAIVTDFPKRGIQVQHDLTLKYFDDQQLIITSLVMDNNNPYIYTKSDNSPHTPKHPLENDPKNSVLSIVLSGVFGTVSNGATNPLLLGDPWFEPGNYIGALDPLDNWTVGWTREL